MQGNYYHRGENNTLMLNNSRQYRIEQEQHNPQHCVYTHQFSHQLCTREELEHQFHLPIHLASVNLKLTLAEVRYVCSCISLLKTNGL